MSRTLRGKKFRGYYSSGKILTDPKKGESFMKKISDATVLWGCYWISVILGAAVTFAVSMGLCSTWVYIYRQAENPGDFLDHIWLYVPLWNVSNRLGYSGTVIVMMVALIAVVLLAVGLVTGELGKHWQSKIMQAFAIAGTIMGIEGMYAYAGFVILEWMSPLMMLFPTTILFVSFLVLVRKRESYTYTLIGEMKFIRQAHKEKRRERCAGKTVYTEEP